SAIFRFAVRLVVANGLEEIVVLLLVRIFAAFVSRHPPPILTPDNVAADIAGTFGAHAIFGHAVPAVQNVTALAGATRAVLIFEFNVMMIEDFAIIRAFAHFTSPHAIGSDRIALLEPIDYIEVMDVLLDDMIAAQPDEVVPVPHLILHFREIASGLLF